MTDLELIQSVEAQAYQAKEAQHLLGHESLKKAFEATEMRITRQWREAQSSELREACWAKLQAFLVLKTELRAFADRPPLPNV